MRAPLHVLSRRARDECEQQQNAHHRLTPSVNRYVSTSSISSADRTVPYAGMSDCGPEETERSAPRSNDRTDPENSCRTTLKSSTERARPRTVLPSPVTTVTPSKLFTISASGVSSDSRK